MQAKIITKITILFLSLLYIVSGSSLIQDFRFSHLTTDHGLSQSNVTSIFQDSKGFIWIGTFNGLNRYDGYKFELFNYDLNDDYSISHNYISAISEDHNGYLWVGTTDGLNRFDRKTNRFKSYKFQENNFESIRDNQIETIFEDSKHRLWIGTRNGGLELYNDKNDSFIHHIHNENNEKSISSNHVRELFEDHAGNLWIGHWNGAIDIFPHDRNEIERISFKQKFQINSPITEILESPDKKIWIGTQGDGLYCFKYEQNRIQLIDHYLAQSSGKKGISSNIVLSLMLDSQNKLWIGTEDEGISILDIETNKIQYCKHDPYDQYSLNHDSVWLIFEDREKNIWIGTYAHGVNLLTRRKSYFKHYELQPENANSINHNMINSFTEDKDGNLWIATDGGGLNFFDRKNNQFSHYNSENSNIGTDVIVCLFEDSRGRFWIGTWTNGLYLFDKSSKIFTHYTKEKHGLGSNRILNIFEDKNGGLWLSTFWGGLTYFNIDNQTVEVYNKKNSGLSDDDVRVAIQDFEGNLWIGTDVGLDYFNPQKSTFINYKHQDQNEKSLSKGFVQSLIQTHDSTIWVGTAGGLNKFNQKTNTFTHFNTSNGLPNNEIKCIIEDEAGILWLSTNKGISRFNAKKKSFKNYDVSDGLQENEFNTNSGYKTMHHEVIFGGNNGFNIFHPDELKDNPHIPSVIITDFKIFNKSITIGGEKSPLQKHISETQHLTLSYQDAVFSFEFVALNYISPEKNQYAYMMEDFEHDWNYVKSSRTATYTNLDPGNYTFKLKASNNDGLWNEEGVSISIKINPPFWKTWWAYLLEFILAIAVIGFVLNYFISRQRLRNALKMEQVELKNIYELDQMKTQFYNNISHEFHSPLTLILSPLEKLITSRKKNDPTKSSLMLIHRNAQRLQRMINQLKDFQKIETGDLQLSLSRGNIFDFIQEIVNSFQEYAKDHEINFQFKKDQDSALVWFDPDKVEKIIYNLLSNSFNFTPDEGKIMITASIISGEKLEESNHQKNAADSYIEICVQDNGKVIPEDKIENIFKPYFNIENQNSHQSDGNSIGLTISHELVKLYQGEITVTSKKGKGTQFIVHLPVDEQYLEENQLVSEFNISPLEIASEQNYQKADFKKFNEKEIIKPETPITDIPVILIVENDNEIRDYIKNSLKSKYRLYCAKNEHDGFKKAVKVIPDLIISDINIAEISTTQLFNKIKDEEKTSHIPIILLTAYSSKEDKIRSLIKGADAYLTKPFNIDVLEAQVSNLLESRKKLREKFSREIHLGPQKVKISSIDEKFLQRVMETVEKHISDTKFNAEALSEKVGMSRMQLYRKLSRLTDQTVHEFIRSIRLKRAVQLLEEKRMTITEIAYEVGFNDLTYFARCFRKQYKKSPSEYISNKN